MNLKRITLICIALLVATGSLYAEPANDAYDEWRATRAAGGVPANRIGGPTKPYEPPDDQLAVIKLMEAIYKAAEEGKEVRL